MTNLEIGFSYHGLGDLGTLVNRSYKQHIVDIMSTTDSGVSKGMMVLYHPEMIALFSKVTH